MICLQCESEEFVVKPDVELEQEFRGETLKVHSPAMACSKCSWVTVGLEQLDELRKRTADAYREKHGLLTSAKIKTMRAALKKSQQEFADFLRVGVASVKRWETWQVQDASSDELMKAKFENERLRGQMGSHSEEIEKHVVVYCLGGLNFSQMQISFSDEEILPDYSTGVYGKRVPTQAMSWSLPSKAMTMYPPIFSPPIYGPSPPEETEASGLFFSNALFTKRAGVEREKLLN